MKLHKFAFAGALLAFAAGVALSPAAETPTLKVGDPAPKLQVGKWIQGDPVKGFEKDKAYIVEFWATWCGPCKATIPHLNEIANKYKDKGLVVIGQDCWERDDEAVEPFVKKMGDKMTYRVALDDKSKSDKGAMAETWMEAAGRDGIPSGFLVDKKGLIAWIGHPMELKEKTIEAVLDGTFDVKKAATEANTEKENMDKLRVIFTDLQKAMQAGKWDVANAKLTEAEKIVPENLKDSIQMARFAVLVGQKDYPAAYKTAGEISDAHVDNPMLQNELAWRIATDETLEKRDLELAQKMADRANTATKGKDAGVLDTVARVQFMRGKKDEAIATEQKAIDIATGDAKAQLQKSLDSYKKGELPKAD